MISIDNSLAQELASLADIPDGYQVSTKSHDLQPLQPPRTTQNKSTFMGNKPPSHKPTFTKKNIPAPVKSDTNNTVYISSSMFRFLDPIQLSSERQMAHVFFYPGADASQMHDRLTQDPKYNELHNYSVQKVYILTGSNNVDNIYLGKKYLQEGTRGISNLINYLKGHFKQAVINILNILPRRTKGRNHVINELNLHIKSLCQKDSKLNYMDTETELHLFSDERGFRKEKYFSLGSDNVHLRRTIGISRLAKYLKYWAHDT